MVERLMQQALDSRPADATDWSVRSFTRDTPLSTSIAHRGQPVPRYRTCPRNGKVKHVYDQVIR